jgi:hypothetical protein
MDLALILPFFAVCLWPMAEAGNVGATPCQATVQNLHEIWQPQRDFSMRMAPANIRMAASVLSQKALFCGKIHHEDSYFRRWPGHKD